MDEDARIGKRLLDFPFTKITEAMGLFHAHPIWHGKVEVNVFFAARPPGAYGVYARVRMPMDAFLDCGKLLRGKARIDERTKSLAEHAP